MASGSGKNQEGNQTEEPVESEESNAATATATAAAAEPPPPAPPSERLQERAHGSPEAGGRNSFAATAAEAAAAAQRKGTGIGAPSCRRYAGGKPPLPPLAPSVSRAREPKSATGKPPLPPRAVRASKSKGKKPMSDAEVVKSGMEVRAKWKDMREGRMYMKDVLDELLEESKANADIDQEDEPEGTAMQQEQVKSATIWPENYYKGSIWRKFLDRIGISDLNSRIANPDVNYETIPMFDVIRHYRLLEMVAGRGVEFHSNALNLRRTYSEFRPVRGDGECFYRSFIFSYLEQVLDRQDTHEEHRLLVAVKEVARQHERLGWASEFSRSHKEFKKLIKKVMRWKRHSRWKHVQTTNSYRKKKLLQYFNSYDKTNDIFAFLGLVAAIWISSHSDEFEPLIREVNILTDWCFVEVIQSRVLTDHIQITALVNALRVPLRVEYLFQEFGQDLYTGEGSQDTMPGSTCSPRRHHQVPLDHKVPQLTMLYTNLQCNIFPSPDAIIENFHQEKTKFKRSVKAKAVQALELPPPRDGSISCTICAAVRIGWLGFLSVRNSVLSWIAGCFGKRQRPTPPSEFSWISVMGKPILNEDASCTIASCTMCIEAQHRLAFERVNGRGSFTFKAKVPAELKKACSKRGIWNREDGPDIREILKAIAQKGGVLTERVPNNIKLPISGYHCLHDIGGFQLMRLICAHGPVIGILWAELDDYDRAIGDIVYRRTPMEYRFPNSGAYHAVVCFGYKYDPQREELHIRVMDNHAEDGPLRWISFAALEEFYLPLIPEPVELHKLRRKKKREEHSVSAYVTHSMVTLEKKLMTWIRCRELDRFYKPRQQDVFLLDNKLRHGPEHRQSRTATSNKR